MNRYKLNDEGVPCYRHSLDVDLATEPITARFDRYTCPEDYISAGIKYIVPMTAKELEDRAEQKELLDSEDYYVEEKFDGTRGIMHLLSVPDFDKDFPNWKDIDVQYLYKCLLYGTGFSEGRRRVYDFFHNNTQGRAEFLKKEFGIGGFANSTVDADYNAKGFTIRGLDEDSKRKTYSWSEVAQHIDYLIDRGYYYPQDGYARVFSRRESKKTGWLTENTDSVPQLRDLNCPELAGTIIDGEMFIPEQPFKAVASTLNCKYDKAIARQLEIGGIVFHAFDILFFKGIDLRKMPLYRRKVYLQIVCDKLNSPYVKMVDYYDRDDISVPSLSMSDREKVIELKDTYPNLAECVLRHEKRLKDHAHGKFKLYPQKLLLTKRAYYEYIVFTGGEGVILKPKTGRYFHKRGREYLKIKKFLTRECIICGFTEPTREYNGKFPNDTWEYWVDQSGVRMNTEDCKNASAKSLRKKGMIPVTKYYYERWIGNIEYGVIITDEEIEKLPKNKKHDIRTFTPKGKTIKVLVVGECGGFDEEMRAYLTQRRTEYVGAVIEVKANEIFRDTGKLRHPRYLRMRFDKSAEQCTFSEHIQ